MGAYLSHTSGCGVGVGGVAAGGGYEPQFSTNNLCSGQESFKCSFGGLIIARIVICFTPPPPRLDRFSCRQWHDKESY